jgi:hypothetical protein
VSNDILHTRFHLISQLERGIVEFTGHRDKANNAVYDRLDKWNELGVPFDEGGSKLYTH